MPSFFHANLLLLYFSLLGFLNLISPNSISLLESSSEAQSIHNNGEISEILSSSLSVDTSLPLPAMSPRIIELCKDLFKKWSNLDDSRFSVETVSGGITNLCGDWECLLAYFANDGSFMERFKQLQQETQKAAAAEDSRTGTDVTNSTPTRSSGKTGTEFKHSDVRKTVPASSGSKLAFSLKQKSKLVVPAVNLSEEDDDVDRDIRNARGRASAKRQRMGRSNISESSSTKADVAPPSPSDPAVKKVADRLASFAAKNGRQIEDITRQKNPGNTPFRFLFDPHCTEYKYYEYRFQEEEKALAKTKDIRIGQSGVADSSQSEADPIAMMEYYAKKAAAEEKKKAPKQSDDEMPPPTSLQASGKRGHHMGDYIPLEELESFMAKCDDVAAQKAAKEAADKAKIQADNVGHKLLSKMGWREGEGLGSSRKGIADPIQAGNVKKDHLGVGAQQPGEVTPEDDIYEQYKKRIMLGYCHRHNPLNNPRKAYY